MKKFLINLSIILAIFASSQSYAGTDGKIYPGAACQRHSGSNNYLHTAGTIKNNSTSETLTVVCPVVKDVMAKSIRSGWVKVADRHPRENFDCSLKSKYRKDTGLWTNYLSGSKKSAGTLPPTQTLKFGSVSHVSGGSHYYIVCTIPKRETGELGSFIASYRVDEKD